jgi:hypothetical protein
VQVLIIVHSEAVSEAALRHLNDGVLDGIELALDLRIVFREIRQRAHDFQSFLLAAFQDQPSKRQFLPSASCIVCSTYQRGDSGSPGTTATMISASKIWNAMGKRQETVEGSRKEKPRSIQ